MVHSRHQMATREKEKETEAELWDPFRGFQMAPFGSLFDEFFAPFRAPLPSLYQGWLPRADVQETEKGYVLSVALPGVKKEDVKVDVKDDTLTISGERKAETEEKGRNWLRRETSYGSFCRSFTLPEGLHPEEVKASYADGVLKLAIPKPAGARPAPGVSIKID